MSQELPSLTLLVLLLAVCSEQQSTALQNLPHATVKEYHFLFKAQEGLSEASDKALNETGEAEANALAIVLFPCPWVNHLNLTVSQFPI